MFTAVTVDGQHIRTIDLFTALFDSLNLKQSYNKDKHCKPLENILLDAEKNRRGPVIVFPEGTSGNGRGLLAKNNFFNHFNLERNNSLRTHIIAFKFEWQRFSPTYTVGGRFLHFYYLNSQVFLK